MKLTLGVLNVAYSDATGKKNSRKTTAEVARFLEDKYHVMETFAMTKQNQIAAVLADSVSNAIENMVKHGRRDGAAVTFEGEQKIEALFRAFLSAGEMQRIVNSLTQAEREYFLSSTGGFSGAAKRGINHRKKHPYSKKNKARQAFIDTGLYMASFRAWVQQ